MKLLVYTDGSKSSAKALHFAARLTQKLDAQLTVITTRSGTHGTEPLPPVGQDIGVEASDHQSLPAGLQVLIAALDILSAEGLLERQPTLQIHERPNGHLFFGNTPSGQGIPFNVCFGHMVEILNHEIDKNHYDLLIIAPPRRGRLGRIMPGDISRRLVLDLHTSVLIVRGGGPDSRFFVCADGSAASGRQFPLLRQLLPVIDRPVELACAQSPDSDDTAIERAERGIRQASKLLTNSGKQIAVHRLSGKRPAEAIAKVAGDDAVISLGASLRHDVHRRIIGSLPTRLLARTNASVLVVKALPEGDLDNFEDLDSS